MNKLLGSPKMLEEAKRGKPGHSWIIELLIFLLILFIGERAESIPIAIADFVWILTGDIFSGSAGLDSMIEDFQAFLSSMPEWLMIVNLFATGLIIWVVIVYCRKIERRSTASMGFRKTGFFKEYLTGAVLGILMITAAVVLAMLTGSVTVTPKNLAAPAIGTLLLWLAGYFVQGMSEETMMRGYLMVSMTRRSSLWLSVILSSAVFALLHLANPGIGLLPILNLFLCGLVFGCYMIKRGNIWGVCAMHSFWNFYQGCIFGVSVSGSGSVESALFDCVNIKNMELWNGGTFGLEGGLAVTVVEAAMLLIVLFLVPKAKEEQAAETGPVDGTFTEVKEEVAGEPVPDVTPVPDAVPAPETKEEPAADTDSSPYL